MDTNNGYWARWQPRRCSVALRSGHEGGSANWRFNSLILMYRAIRGAADASIATEIPFSIHCRSGLAKGAACEEESASGVRLRTAEVVSKISLYIGNCSVVAHFHDVILASNYLSVTGNVRWCSVGKMRRRLVEVSSRWSWRI